MTSATAKSAMYIILFQSQIKNWAYAQLSILAEQKMDDVQERAQNIGGRGQGGQGGQGRGNGGMPQQLLESLFDF